MNLPIWPWVLSALSTVGAIMLALTVPAVREAVGKYIAGFVQHRFDQRIENLKSDLRRSEEKFAADLRISERQLRSLADTALALRSSRQVALDARRLAAVEKLWAAKIVTDRMKMAANFVSGLNLDELFKAAEKGDPRIRNFAAALDKLTGLDLEKEAQQASALSERPFLPPDVWALFSAYQSVMTHSVLLLKSLAIGADKFLKKEDMLKPLMLLALPEYKAYIEKFGFAGYYHLLDIIELKLLNAMAEMLDGKTIDDVTLKRSAEIISAARGLSTEARLEIPDELRGSKVPDPPKIR